MQRRILVVRTDRVGDVVMITPMLRELRKKFPDSFIATLTNPNSSDILINNPNVDLLIKDDMRKDSFKKVVKEIRRNRFTHGLLVMPTERAAYQMFLGGVKKRTGVGRKLYEIITLMDSVSRNKYIPLRHEADYCMDLARRLGVVSNNLTPEIFITEEERIAGRTILLNEGISNGDYRIIVHTGSGNSSRNWDEEKYSELIDNILEKHPKAKVILTAKEMSNDFIEKINSGNEKRIVNVTGSIRRLRDLITIIANSDLLIASSTGPLHLASGLNVKTIGLFCHRRMSCVQHWGALGNKAVNLEVSAAYCDSHCSNDKEICRFEDGISVEEVMNNIPDQNGYVQNLIL